MSGFDVNKKMNGQVKNLSFMHMYGENVSQYFIHPYCLIKTKINPIIPRFQIIPFSRKGTATPSGSFEVLTLGLTLGNGGGSIFKRHH